jgi:hypothetical protein
VYEWFHAFYANISPLMTIWAFTWWLFTYFVICIWVYICMYKGIYVHMLSMLILVPVPPERFCLHMLICIWVYICIFKVIYVHENMLYINNHISNDCMLSILILVPVPLERFCLHILICIWVYICMYKVIYVHENMLHIINYISNDSMLSMLILVPVPDRFTGGCLNIICIWVYIYIKVCAWEYLHINNEIYARIKLMCPGDIYIYVAFSYLCDYLTLLMPYWL